jgi:rfaE bifunctional protein kinase chain/domain
MNFDLLFQSFSKIKVAVIGDVMLDTYWWGNVERISPEAPVPVVAVTKREERIGGAGNVALNVKALGAQVHVISMTGNDAEAEKLKGLFDEQGINTAYLLKTRSRQTTNKIRIIGRNQQMMRLDAEVTSALNKEDEKSLLDDFKKYLENETPHVVILEDYNKGVLSKEVITAVITLCKKNHVLTAVDPKRKNFFEYREVDIFKPNLHEAKEGLNLLTDTVTLESMSHIHELLKKQLGHRISFITLSEKGVFYQEADHKRIIPTHVRSIADVSGAGDTVVAVASVVYAATKDVNLMAEMANIAGGLVCEEVGTVAINKDRLLEECKTLLSLRN